jgi:hypothetical protein
MVNKGKVSMAKDPSIARKVRKLRASRDGWKERAAKKQQQLKRLRVTVRDLSVSRNYWKARFQELEQSVQPVQHSSTVNPGALPLLDLVWGVDQPATSQEDLASFQPITSDDLISAKGHVYPLLLVRLALTWVCDAHSSYRAAALLFSTLNGLGMAVGPCAETIRLWLLRVGLFLLRRPVPPYRDWVYLVDLTIRLGQHKCLVILGISLAQFRRNGCRLEHHDVHILSVQVLPHSSAKTIARHLHEVCQRTGTPLEIVSDHGSDILAGIRLFRAEYTEVIEIYDVTHALGILLEHQLEPDARWNVFVKDCQRTRQQLQQTTGSFLQPPAWRQKSCYLNLESHLAWANDMLLLLNAKADETVAKQLGLSVEQSRAWLEEKLGWIQGYQDEIRQWSYFVKIVKCAEEEIKQKGLRQSSWQRIRQHLQQGKPVSQREKHFRLQTLKLVRDEGAKVPARQCYVGSIDVLESLFGKYKELAERGPCREITANVLMIPLFVTPLTAELLREALESVHEQDVRLWVDDHLESTPQKKKRIVLAASHEKSEDLDLG